MKPFPRSQRVGGLIQQVLSALMQKEISDPRLELTTITTVKMSRDLKNARIYFAVAGGPARVKDAAEAFGCAQGYIRRALARQLELRYMPTLKFYYDDSFDYGSHIDQVLESIRATDHGSDNTPTATE